MTIFCLSLVIRILAVEMYVVSGSSMEKSLLNGDRVLLNKLSYGAVLPRSLNEIPWISIFANSADSAKWAYRRMPGLGSISRNDIVVASMDGGQTYIKRCIGQPGDIFEIKNGNVMTNGIEHQESESIIKYYTIYFNNLNDLSQLMDSIQCPFIFYPGSNSINSSLSNKESLLVKSRSSVDSLVLKVNYPEKWVAYPNNIEYAWTFDDMGPLVVPRKGMTINLTKSSYLLYKNIIETYENVSLCELDTKFYNKGREVTQYTFNGNYYMLLGDNRINSKDSRYLGFVPEQNILGKASCILFSIDDGIRWERVFLSI